LKIAELDLGQQPVFLAPMEDVTDPPFRYICKQYGAAMVYTEFVSSEALIRDIKKTQRKLELFEYERPIGIQIYGHVLESMVQAAIIAAEAKPDVIDINFGCPVKKIATRGAGAGLLNNVPLMVKMTEAIVKAVNIPVTAKTRLGWDENTKHIVEISEQLQDVGIKALTIHGRTRAQLYTGKADWTLIGEVKNNPRMHIPIIGNGDIISAESAKKAFNDYGVDGIMVGRGAIGKPWLFKEIRHYLDHNILLPEPSVEDKVELAKLQFHRSLEWKGEMRGIFEMRRHFCNYFKGLPDFKEIRIKLVTSTNQEEILELLEKIKTVYHGYTAPNN
jgi:tRNA-dihydrouridine synthase B